MLQRNALLQLTHFEHKQQLYVNKAIFIGKSLEKLVTQFCFHLLKWPSPSDRLQRWVFAELDTGRGELGWEGRGEAEPLPSASLQCGVQWPPLQTLTAERLQSSKLLPCLV